jgi:hypothetical protein
MNRNERWLVRKRDGLLKRLARVGPFVDGSIVLIGRTCGNTQFCKCSRGIKHISPYLTYSVKGKTHTLYLPVDLQAQVRVWSGRYRVLKKLIKEIGEVQKEIIHNHVQEKIRRQGRA